MRKRDRSGRRRRSSLKPAEEIEEEEDQEVESSTTQEVVMSPQKSVLSEEMDESREDSIPGLEEIQVDRDSSLRSPPNQASVLVYEEEEEEKKKVEEEREEEEEEEEEEDEEEEEEEQRSSSVDEVGQQRFALGFGTCAVFTVCVPSTSRGPQWGPLALMETSLH